MLDAEPTLLADEFRMADSTIHLPEENTLGKYRKNG